MSYSHNAEADFAASELARMFAADPCLCYTAATQPSGLSANASYEPSSTPWPKADALVSLLETGTGIQRDIAVEYKREQEGAHGLLTAIGQAHSYLFKGYSGAAIVVPSAYPSHSSPAEYVRNVLDCTSGNKAIGVFRFDPPDLSSPTPYAERLHLVRPLELITTAISPGPTSSRPRTQWVHMREGSTTRDAFLRFLQTAKLLSADGVFQEPAIPVGLSHAIARLAPGKDPAAYLANTADEKFLTRVWRVFWFNWIATAEVLTPWKVDGGRSLLPMPLPALQRMTEAGIARFLRVELMALKKTSSAC